MIYTYFGNSPGWCGGIRRVVLFHTGRKWIRILDTGTLEVYRLPVAELPRLKPQTAKPKALARRLTARRALFKRHGIRISNRAVAQAVRRLREG